MNEIIVAKNMKIWNEVAQPPKEVLKQIPAGRLKGKTNIDPQWRLKALTERFGPCGIGWKLETVRQWTDPGPEGQVFASTHILLYIRVDKEWSDPIPGTGGSMLIVKQFDKHKNTEVLYLNDDAFKMSETDALSVACKRLGFGAAIYMGQWDGEKYITGPISIDENKLADWLIAVEEAAEGLLEDLLKWWPDNKSTITKDCGEGVAARIYSKYVGLLNKKRAEKKAAE